MNTFLIKQLLSSLCQQVRLVQKIDSGKIYAMKTLQKAEMLKRDQVKCAVLPYSVLYTDIDKYLARPRPRRA